LDNKVLFIIDAWCKHEHVTLVAYIRQEEYGNNITHNDEN